MSLLEYALEYARMGKSVIPVDGDKRPLVKWEEFQKRCASEEEIKSWFKKFPKANIGIVTGEISNLLVVDCDTKSAIERVQEAIPDGLLIPCQNTPSGGMHFFFRHAPGFVNRARVSEGIDIRSSGGYACVAPSINGNGKGWYWVISLSDAESPDINIALGSILSSFSFSLYTRTRACMIEDKNQYHNISQASQSITNFFVEPGRDEDIFHIANSAIKGNANVEILTEALKIIGRNCIPPFPENEVEIKVKSAIQRAMKKEVNISQEVRSWVEMMREVSQAGHITFTEWHKEHNVSQKKDLHAGRMAFKRLCEEENPMIERVEDRPGHYRIIKKDDTEQEWWKDEGIPLKIKIPLRVELYAKIFPGNIILLEGQKSQGKSTFSLEFSRINRELYPGRKIIYQNIEMSDSEIKDRFSHYEERKIINSDEWKKFLRIKKVTSGWWDIIEPDSVNIIDYLIEYEKPYILPQFIFNIHKKLKTGIALCVVQRDPFKPYPMGGRGARDIPRLVLSLINHRLLLEDVKSFWKTDQGNPSKLSIKYKQISYCELVPDGNWERLEDSKYEAFRKDTNKYKSYLKED